MDLHNHTPYPALLARFGADDDVMGAALVVRVTYDIAGGRLFPSAEQAWPVSPAPWECEYGPMEPDSAFYKGGVDLFVFGSACAPYRRAVTHMGVLFEVGRFRRELAIFGNRAWLPRGTTVVMSAPQPFVTMPLTMENAYGGAGKWDGLEVSCPDNPKGKGFNLDLMQAVGKQLPNIEDPQSLIRRWDDRPTPVGVRVCPMAFSTRLQRGAEFTDKGALKKLNGRLFNCAFPEMVVEDVRPGDPVRLSGVTPDTPVSFVIPEPPVTFRASYDAVTKEAVPGYDQIGVEVEKNRVFITYRYSFRYVLYRRQKRKAELVMRQGMG